jgi:hypothetical protein
MDRAIHDMAAAVLSFAARRVMCDSNAIADSISERDAILSRQLT